MIEGLKLKHRIKTFLRHEDWSSNKCLNAAWNCSGRGDIKANLELEKCNEHVWYQLLAITRFGYTVWNVWKWRTLINYLLSPLYWWVITHFISTWWVLDHISNRWLNIYPEPDRIHVKALIDIFELNIKIFRVWNFPLRSSLHHSDCRIKADKLHLTTTYTKPSNLPGSFLPMAIFNCLNDVTFT